MLCMWVDAYDLEGCNMCYILLDAKLVIDCTINGGIQVPLFSLAEQWQYIVVGVKSSAVDLYQIWFCIGVSYVMLSNLV